MKRCSCCRFWERLFTTSAPKEEQEVVKKKKQKPSTSDAQKNAYPIVRNFKSMYTIANMLDLRELAKFSMCCRSFYWIAGRKQLLEKFYRFNVEAYRRNNQFMQSINDDESRNIAYESWRANGTPRSIWGRKGPISGTAPQNQRQQLIDQIQSNNPSNQVNNLESIFSTGDIENAKFVSQQQLPPSGTTYERTNKPSNSTRQQHPNYQPLDIITDQVGEFKPTYLPFGLQGDDEKDEYQKESRRRKKKKRPRSSRNASPMTVHDSLAPQLTMASQEECAQPIKVGAKQRSSVTPTNKQKQIEAKDNKKQQDEPQSSKSPVLDYQGISSVKDNFMTMAEPVEKPNSHMDLYKKQHSSQFELARSLHISPSQVVFRNKTTKNGKPIPLPRKGIIESLPGPLKNHISKRTIASRNQVDDTLQHSSQVPSKDEGQYGVGGSSYRSNHTAAFKSLNENVEESIGERKISLPKTKKVLAEGRNKKQSQLNKNGLNPSHHNSGFSISLVNHHIGNINIANDVFCVDRAANVNSSQEDQASLQGFLNHNRSLMSPTFNGAISKQYEIQNDALNESQQPMFFKKDESIDHEQLLPGAQQLQQQSIQNSLKQHSVQQSLKQSSLQQQFRDKTNSSMMKDSQKSKSSKQSKYVESRLSQMKESYAHSSSKNSKSPNLNNHQIKEVAPKRVQTPMLTPMKEKLALAKDKVIQNKDKPANEMRLPQVAQKPPAPKENVTSPSDYVAKVPPLPAQITTPPNQALRSTLNQMQTYDSRALSIRSSQSNRQSNRTGTVNSPSGAGAKFVQLNQDGKMVPVQYNQAQSRSNLRTSGGDRQSCLSPQQESTTSGKQVELISTSVSKDKPSTNAQPKRQPLFQPLIKTSDQINKLKSSIQNRTVKSQINNANDKARDTAIKSGSGEVQTKEKNASPIENKNDKAKPIVKNEPKPFEKKQTLKKENKIVEKPVSNPKVDKPTSSPKIEKPPANSKTEKSPANEKGEKSPSNPIKVEKQPSSPQKVEKPANQVKLEAKSTETTPKKEPEPKDATVPPKKESQQKSVITPPKKEIEQKSPNVMPKKGPQLKNSNAEPKKEIEQKTTNTQPKKETETKNISEPKRETEKKSAIAPKKEAEQKDASSPPKKEMDLKMLKQLVTNSPTKKSNKVVPSQPDKPPAQKKADSVVIKNQEIKGSNELQTSNSIVNPPQLNKKESLSKTQQMSSFKDALKDVKSRIFNNTQYVEKLRSNTILSPKKGAGPETAARQDRQVVQRSSNESLAKNAKMPNESKTNITKMQPPSNITRMQPPRVPSAIFNPQRRRVPPKPPVEKKDSAMMFKEAPFIQQRGPQQRGAPLKANQISAINNPPEQEVKPNLKGQLYIAFPTDQDFRQQENNNALNSSKNNSLKNSAERRSSLKNSAERNKTTSPRLPKAIRKKMKELQDEDNPYNQSLGRNIQKKAGYSKDNTSMSSSIKPNMISQEELIKLHGDGQVLDMSQYYEGSFGDHRLPPKIEGIVQKVQAVSSMRVSTQKIHTPTQRNKDIQMNKYMSNELQFVYSSQDDSELPQEEYEYRASLNKNGPINVNDQSVESPITSNQMPILTQQQQPIRLIFDGQMLYGVVSPRPESTPANESVSASTVGNIGRRRNQAGKLHGAHMTNVTSSKDTFYVQGVPIVSPRTPPIEGMDQKNMQQHDRITLTHERIQESKQKNTQLQIQNIELANCKKQPPMNSPPSIARLVKEVEIEDDDMIRVCGRGDDS